MITHLNTLVLDHVLNQLPELPAPPARAPVPARAGHHAVGAERLVHQQLGEDVAVLARAGGKEGQISE